MDGFKFAFMYKQDGSSCCSLFSNSDSVLKISDIYAVEFIDFGVIHESTLTNAAGGCLFGHSSEVIIFIIGPNRLVLIL